MIVDVLDSAGVEVKYGREDEINICCPFCVKRGETEDSRFRLGINTATGEAHCFNCNWRARGLSFTVKQLCEAFEIPYRVVRHKTTIAPKKERKPEVRVAGLPAEYERFTSHDDFIGRKARAYLHARGISELQIHRHKIGYAGAGDYAWRVLFPFIDAEEVIHGCAARTIRHNVQPKYLNTPGMKILWNAKLTASTAVVVEGVIDALHVETALLRERDMIAVARLGSSVSKPQMDQLKNYERVIVFPDRDRAGIQGAEEMCRRCDDRGISVKVVLPSKLDGMDPGSMSEDEIVDLLHAAVPWTKAAEWRLRAVAAKGDSLGDGGTDT